MWRVSSLSVNSALVNSVRHSPLLCQDLKGRGSVKFSEDLWGDRDGRQSGGRGRQLVGTSQTVHPRSRPMVPTLPFFYPGRPDGCQRWRRVLWSRARTAFSIQYK